MTFFKKTFYVETSVKVLSPVHDPISFEQHLEDILQHNVSYAIGAGLTNHIVETTVENDFHYTDVHIIVAIVYHSLDKYNSNFT